MMKLVAASAALVAVVAVAGCSSGGGAESAGTGSDGTASRTHTPLPPPSVPTTTANKRINTPIGEIVGLSCSGNTIDTCDVEFSVTDIRAIDPSRCYAPEGYSGTYAAIDVEVKTSEVFTNPAVASVLRWPNWSFVDDRGVTVIDIEPGTGCSDWSPDALYGDLREDSKLEATLVVQTPNGIEAVRLDPPETEDNWEWTAP